VKEHLSITACTEAGTIGEQVTSKWSERATCAY